MPDENADIDYPLFSQLPDQFRLNKQIEIQSIANETEHNTFAQRMRDGEDIVIIKNKKGRPQVYTRDGMLINDIGYSIKPIAEQAAKIEYESMVIFSLSYERNEHENISLIQYIIFQRDMRKSRDAIEHANEDGTFILKAKDVIFWKREFVGKKASADRVSILSEAGLSPDILIDKWKDKIETFSSIQWRGLIIRSTCPSRHDTISFSLNGKTQKGGGKFLILPRTEDFIVTGIRKCSNGKCKVEISQYVRDGELSSFGWIPFQLHSASEQTRTLHMIENGTNKIHFGIEVMYKYRDNMTGVITNGKVIRLKSFKNKPQMEFIYKNELPLRR